MPSTFPSMKRAGSIFIIFSALILVSTDALLLFPLSPVAGHSFVVTLNKNESLSPLSEFAFAFGESHSVPFTDCLLPDGATRFLTSCECAVALAREPGFSVVHKGVPIVRNVTFVPGFFLPSRASLFQPLTLSLVTPVSGTKLCFNDSVVFLDYRPFDVLPSRRDAFERIGDALIPAGSKNTVVACHNFMNKGIYRFSMMSTSVELHLNSTTKPPSVHFREDSIFPHCSGDFSLTWDLPSCPLPATTTTQFRIRVLAVLDTPPNTPEEWLYVEEIPVENTTGPSSTSIPCSQFDIVYRKFCFELVAVDDRSHRVAEWDRRCVFTEPLRRIDGNWTSWGKWSSCSVTCGSNGVRKRTRSCTNPAPSGGNFCIGSALEISNCTEPQPNCTTSDVIDRRQALLLRNGSSVPSCLCGCRVPDTLGVIHATRHHGCTNATLVWSFAPQHDSRVHLLVIANGNMRAQDYGLKVVKGLSGEIKWSSWQSSAHPIEVPLDEEVQIIFETKNISSRKSNSPRTGFFVDYRISTAPSEMFLLSHEYSAQLGLSWAFGHCSTPACQRAVIGVLLISIVFVIVILLAVPPLACSYATKKVLQNRRHDSTGSEALLTSLSQRLDAADNMYRSGGTNTTHLMSSSSGASSSHAQTGPESVFSIAKRSVGIQMSVQSTPRTTRSTRGPDGTLLGSLEELEYDFYDPVVPDSLLRPYVPSELDIDRIVEQETTGWYRPPVGGSVVDDDPDDRPGPSSSSF